jgi:hypothetical protein
MCIVILQRELSINAQLLLKCDNNVERLELLNQRANIKDLIIELLTAQLNNIKAA